MQGAAQQAHCYGLICDMMVTNTAGTVGCYGGKLVPGSAADTCRIELQITLSYWISKKHNARYVHKDVLQMCAGSS